MKRLLDYEHILRHAARESLDHSAMYGHGAAYGMRCMARKYSRDYGKILEILRIYNLDDSYDYSVGDVYDIVLRDERNTKDMVSSMISEKIGDCIVLSMSKSDYKRVLSDICED